MLTEVHQNARRVLASTEPLAGPALHDPTFWILCQRIHAASGIKLGAGKEQLVQSRVARRLRELDLDSFEAYVRHLDADPSETRALISAITTHLTFFFREAHHFELLARHASAARAPLRIWSSACSTGEEPCSIAMVLEETHAAGRVLATDIDDAVLTQASEGIYTLAHLEGLSEARCRRFLSRGSGTAEGLARVKPVVRGRIEYRNLNLVGPWSMRAPLDIIFCRNVLIYFDAPTQARVVRRLADALAVGGVLFLGHSEALPEPDPRLELIGHTAFRRVS